MGGLGAQVDSKALYRRRKTPREAASHVWATPLFTQLDTHVRTRAHPCLPTKAKAPMSPRNQRLRALIIDDEPMVANTLAAMVRRCGATYADMAHNGSEALERLGQEHFDLILCDLNMPNTDGIETMRRLADHGVRSAIILLSGSDPRLLRAAEDLGRNRGLNIVAAMSKPAHLAELRRTMELAVQPSRSQRPSQVPEGMCADELENAIHHGQLCLHFQPQVHMCARTVDSAEALIRWQHPSLGLIAPDAFIPMAEASGLIEPLTTWVVNEAIRQGAAWRSCGESLPVAVNFSAKTLCHLDLPDRLEHAIRAARMAPEDLTLEVTESGVVDDIESMLDITTRLRIKRFPLSIDDFGTGASTLAQLQRLPFSELKIDRMFVHGAARDADNRALLASTVELAQSQQLKVVAEGIETREEWDIVASLGVDLAQGYYVARPMSAAQLRRWRHYWTGRVA